MKPSWSTGCTNLMVQAGVTVSAISSFSSDAVHVSAVCIQTSTTDVVLLPTVPISENATTSIR